MRIAVGGVLAQTFTYTYRSRPSIKELRMGRQTISEPNYATDREFPKVGLIKLVLYN